MSQVFGAVARLALRPQNQFVDHARARGTAHLVQNGVDVVITQFADFARFNPQRSQERLQSGGFFGAWRFVDAVHRGDALFLQRFGGGDIRQNHKFFDRFVAVQPFARGNRSHLSVFVQLDFAFDNVQIQRAAFFPRGIQNQKSPAQIRDVTAQVFVHFG